MKRTLVCILAMLCAASAAQALQKEEVLVVYNRNVAGSKELADYYVSKRGIPAEHVLGIGAPEAEHISRPLYLDQVEAPIKAWMDKDDHKTQIRCILLMRGMPLGVNRMDDPEKRAVRTREFRAWKAAEERQKKLEAERNALKAASRDAKSTAKEMIRVEKEIATAVREADTRKKVYETARAAYRAAVWDTDVCVDSELAVMYFANHPVQRWMPNMLHFRMWNRPDRKDLPKTFMVCRLDGPRVENVRRMIDDSVATEATGL
ncbi:MAG TPA: TIGR03790 family protein, partial [Planctomycetota bacterium]|nr:TIGR03790 family protein [Planctomycetota bacterium]